MKLHFERHGEGPPMVILHGLLGSGDNWHGMAKIWAQNFTILVPDLRNHGRSPHANEAGFAAMADDVRELMDGDGLSQVTVLGHSLGGKVAMQLAMDYSELVKRLIVVDIAPKSYPPAHKALLDALLAVDLSKFTTRSEIDAVLAGSIPQPAIRQWLLKNLGRLNEGAFYWKPNLRVLHEKLAELSGDFAEMRAFHGPTLFVAGGNSNYIRSEDEPRIREYFPQARLETIAGAGHWVHVDAPGKLIELVQQFAGE
ncbi:MAG TPA: alpha/beta fold hydrolase [Verrucomicrobiae bacterium]